MFKNPLVEYIYQKNLHRIADAKCCLFNYSLTKCGGCGYVWFPRIPFGGTDEELPERCTNCHKKLEYPKNSPSLSFLYPR